jgi:hypothetical protein
MTMPKVSRCLLALPGCLLMTGLATAEPQYKIQVNPFLAAFGEVNIQVDRQVAENLSTGLMLTYLDPSMSYDNEASSSIGIRLDRYDRGVFNSGWHTNAMLKINLSGTKLEDSRLVATQTYQKVRADFVFNAGLGLQIVYGGDASMFGFGLFPIPSLEFSIGRAF